MLTLNVMEIFVDLSGVPATFEIKVKPAKNYPVDLYYLMDLSNSMRDDLDKLKNLGSKIGKCIKLIIF